MGNLLEGRQTIIVVHFRPILVHCLALSYLTTCLRFKAVNIGVRPGRYGGLWSGGGGGVRQRWLLDIKRPGRRGGGGCYRWKEKNRHNPEVQIQSKYLIPCNSAENQSDHLKYDFSALWSRPTVVEVLYCWL